MKQPFYFVLLAGYAPTHFYLANRSLFPLTDALIVAAIMAACAALLFALAVLFYRSSHKAAVLVAFCVAGCGLVPVDGLAVHAWLVTVVAIAILLRKVGLPPVVSSAANTFMILLVVTAVGLAWAESAKEPQASAQTPLESDSPFEQLADRKPRTTPSIIHIVLDGYSSNQVLRTLYGWDNTSFEDALVQRGFTIIQGARAPYNQTLPTMASIMRGSYVLEDLPADPAMNDDQVRVNLGRAVMESPLKQLLQRAGYRFLFTDAGYTYLEPGQAYARIDDRASRSGISEFGFHFLLRTAFSSLLGETVTSDVITQHVRSIDSAFLRSENLPKMGPFMVYQHILAPHPPFVFGATGEITGEFSDFLTIRDGSHATRLQPDLVKRYKEGYINKLRVVNQKITEQIDSIRSDFDGKYVIVIHGDHGGGAYLHQDDPGKTCLEERFSPFLAIYTNDPFIQDAVGLRHHESFNLVNLYRVVLSAMYGEEFPALPDRSHFVPWGNIRGQVEVWFDEPSRCQGGDISAQPEAHGAGV